MELKPVSAEIESLDVQLEHCQELSYEFEDALKIAIEALQQARSFRSKPEAVAQIVDSAFEKLAKFIPDDDE